MKERYRTGPSDDHSVIRDSVIRNFSRGFTLIEVNLAMLIMAGGILSIVGLYSFGFRENRQGREDVAAAAYADAVVSPLMMSISSTNLKWSVFKNEFYLPSKEGWGAYFNSDGVVTSDPLSMAKDAYDSVERKLGISLPLFPSQPKPKLSAALVVMHPKDSAVVTIGFRAVPDQKWGTLLSMPLFYTEVRFQGLANE